MKDRRAFLYRPLTILLFSRPSSSPYSLKLTAESLFFTSSLAFSLKPYASFCIFALLRSRLHKVHFCL